MATARRIPATHAVLRERLHLTRRPMLWMVHRASTTAVMGSSPGRALRRRRVADVVFLVPGDRFPDLFVVASSGLLAFVGLWLGFHGAGRQLAGTLSLGVG